MTENQELVEKFHIYSDEYIKPFCEMHLWLENYFDEEIKTYYDGFLLMDRNERSIIARLMSMSIEELKAELKQERIKLNKAFQSRFQQVMKFIPNWQRENAYNTGELPKEIQDCLSLETDDLNYGEVVKKVREMEEAYHRGCY